MKKIAVFVVALVAMVALSGVVANAANNRFINSSVSIKFDGGSDPYYEQAKFKGNVEGQGDGNAAARCERQRAIRIINDDSGDVVGRGETNREGKYNIGVDSSFVAGDKYFAKARQRQFSNSNRNNTRVTCRRTTSKVITAG